MINYHFPVFLTLRQMGNTWEAKGTCGGQVAGATFQPSPGIAVKLVAELLDSRL